MDQARDHEALLALLARYAHRPFSWRSHDCVRFAAAAVRVQTGRHVLSGLRWQSRRAALALLEREGGLEAAVTARLRPIPPALAARGDIAGVADEALGVRLMVVEGSLLVGPGADGLRRLPRAAMTMAWSAQEEPA